ncbi:asparaginase domain-containing protein [Chitinimonas sp. BJYL2]|uniref:asparaginase domain-containing protein n=1 Tax=Chitinimonas sp. BJYL2 TaxID=2976696 RepID=UPI0022B38557|nr:asparaginase domain-containing protein [Chitinimonas sp. BJYL2]
MPQKRLFVIYAGGTIGMQSTPQGYAPVPGYLPAELQRIATRTPGFPAYTLREYAPLIDSSNLQPAHWNQMAADIAANYAAYDGFVVIHGTDTLAYTASALSFMLENLGKPVIVTGSMVPLCEHPNDAEQNLVDAFHWATEDGLHEVCVAFNRQLLRGNRSRKLWGAEIGAFGSPNYPILGRVQGHYEFNPALCLPKSTKPFKAHSINADLAITGLKLYPGFAARLIEQIMNSDDAPVGVVLETYGAGNAPDADTALISALTHASQRGSVLLNVTQCVSGKASSDYAAGSILARAGLVSGLDITPEAAIAKLYFVLSQPHEVLEPADLLATSLRGEMSAS